MPWLVITFVLSQLEIFHSIFSCEHDVSTIFPKNIVLQTSTDSRGVTSGETSDLTIMAVRVVEFSNGVYKIKKIFAKKSTYPKEIIEFWELD